MRVTYNWLKEFVPIDIPAEELAQKLTLIGPEVTGIKKIGISPDNINKILLARVAAIKTVPHEEKPRIAVLSAARNSLNIITNSVALEKGHYVMAALPGAILHGGIEIRE